MTTATIRRWTLWIGVVLVAGCHSQPTPRPTGTLVMNISPSLAAVLLDDQPLLVRTPTGGPARLRVEAGAHRIEVRALGHLTAYRDVVTRPGEESLLSVTLQRDPETEAESESPPKQPFAPRLPELPARL